MSKKDWNKFEKTEAYKLLKQKKARYCQLFQDYKHVANTSILEEEVTNMDWSFPSEVFPVKFSRWSFPGEVFQVKFLFEVKRICDD